MAEKTPIFYLFPWTFLFSQACLIAPSPRICLGCLSPVFLIYHLSVTIIITYAILVYVYQLRASDPEWYIPYMEHYLIDVFIAIVWYVLYIVSVITPLHKRRLFKHIVDGLQDIHDSIIVLLDTHPNYGRGWIDTEAILRMLMIFIAVILNYMKLEYSGDFFETWYKLVVYLPMVVLSALHTQAVTFFTIIRLQLQVITNSVNENHLLLEKLIVLIDKSCSICAGLEEFLGAQLFFACIHTFVSVTSNLYFAVFSVTVARGLEGYTASCLIWAALYIMELWRLLAAVSNVQNSVVNFYYSLYDLVVDDESQIIANNPRLILHLEKKYRLRFKVGGFLDFDLTLLPPMFGAICTNLVLCVQFQEKIKL